MHVRFLVVAAAVVTTALIGAPAGQALESRIDAVTVYPRGADVTRVATIALTPGTNVVTLDGLPGNVDPGRLTALVDDERVEVRFIRLDVQEQREAFDAEVSGLEAAIREVKDAIEAIDDEIAAAELQLKFLEGLTREYAGSERGEAAAGRADIASWQQAMDTIGTGAAAAMEKMREARKLRREEEKELSVLERELENKRGRRAASTRLAVSLASQVELKTSLRVTYFQRQARWSSSYTAYLDTDEARLRLTHEAQVSQTTSENWQDVQLALSTGSPGGAMQAPEQDSRFLDLLDPRRPQAMAREAYDAMVAPARALEEIVAPPARLAAGRYAALYVASERTGIPNLADQSQSVPLAEYREDVSLVTRATPRQDARAYLTARYTHDSETPLFAGPMHVFVDGAFMGQTRLPELLSGTEAALPMGPDRQVEVIVTDQGGEKGREGFLTARNTRLTDYLFEIVNRHSRATEVEVLDYYPVPRDERIEVSVPGSATEPYEQDLEERPGVLAWRKSLQPGERWRINHRYEVSYPGDTVITELPENRSPGL